MRKALFILFPVAALLAGCLSDTIDRPEIVVRPIFPPGRVLYTCMNTSDLLVRWNPPVVDTQLNFKGYIVKVYHLSVPFTPVADDGVDSTLGVPMVDSVEIPKIDTMHTFTGGFI